MRHGRCWVLPRRSPCSRPICKTELDRLFADERAFTWREDPLAATADGVHDYDDRLPGVTPADQARRLEADRQGSSNACRRSTAARSPTSTR